MSTMDPANILPTLERLDDAMDDLEESLQPIIKNVSEVATKLPLLDKAKLYVLMTYSIESMLFSALRLNAVDAKEHPVFKELARVRQYFEKIKNIESPPQKPEQSLNREAAIRFIRSDLAGNDKEVHNKLTEMIAKERALAALKTAKIAEKRKLNTSTPSEKSGGESNSKESDSSEESEEEAEVEPVPKKKAKKNNEDKPEKKENDKSDKKGKKEKKDKKSKNEKKGKKTSKD